MRHRTKRVAAALVAAFTVGGIVGLPAMAPAQIQQQLQRRQDKKNEWRNLAYLAGGLTLLGLLNDDKTLTFVGTTGALYSLHRYEEDRKSQSKLARLRAYYFSKPYFYRNGVKYVRKSTRRNGQRYFYFVKAA